MFVAQPAVAPQLSKLALHSSGYGALQRPDWPVSCAAEAGPDLHGAQHQHWPCLPPQGLRAPHPVSQGHQLAQARQVGHMSAHCLPSAGTQVANRHINNKLGNWALLG